MAESGGLWIIDGEGIADVSPWEFSSITQDAGCVFSLQAGAAAHGTYGYRCLWDGVNDQCYGRYDFASSYTSIYVRFYIYVDDTLTFETAWTQQDIFTLLNVSDTPLVRIAISVNASRVPYRWEIQGLALTSTGYTDTIRGAWHYVEVYWIKDAVNGGAIVYIDGIERYSDLVGDTSAANVDQLRIGGMASGGFPEDANDYYYFDDIKADTSYIGPYSEAGGTLEQEAFRFRNDDGDETTATWDAAQDANIQAPAGTTKRLRFIVNATGDPDAAQYQLEGKLSTDSEWTKIT